MTGFKSGAGISNVRIEAVPGIFKNASRIRASLRLRKILRSKPFQRKAVRYAVYSLNIILVALGVFIVIGLPSGKPGNAAAVITSSASKNGSVSDPLDKLSASDIAVSIANAANLPEQTAVRNQAESVQAELAVPPAEDVVSAKPQVVATALKDRQDIQIYTVQNGDTVSSLATKFDVTSNSILWSNGLTGNTLTAGEKLNIPPINGVVYKVKAGDTPQSLAQKFQSSAQQIISFNNAELSGLKTGELILIPDGKIQPPAPTYSTGYYLGASSYGFTPAYGAGNGYDFGYCTWYVATQISIPNNWGNANTWAYYASMSGWHVSSIPSVGAIAQTTAGYDGHVAVVDAVNADGTMIKYRDMNGIAGWDAVGYSSWVPASTFPNYITR